MFIIYGFALNTGHKFYKLVQICLHNNLYYLTMTESRELGFRNLGAGLDGSGYVNESLGVT